MSDSSDDSSDESSAFSSESDSEEFSQTKKKTPTKATPKKQTTPTKTAQPAKRSLALKKDAGEPAPKKQCPTSSMKTSPDPKRGAEPAVRSDTVTAAADDGDISKGPPVTTDFSAKKLLVAYLQQQNRPYSAIQIYENLHKRIPKPNVERLLGALCDGDDAEVRCKEYGKAKIYFYNQAKVTVDFSESDLEKLDADIATAKEALDESQREDKRLRLALAEVTAEPSDRDLLRSRNMMCATFVTIKRITHMNS